MSKARAKGSGWEVEMLPQLRQVFYPHLPTTDKLPDGSDHPLQRAPLKGVGDTGDFTGTPWQNEAKKTDVPHFLQWAKTAQKKTPGRWAILWSGDRRKGDGPFVMLPLAFYLDLAGIAEYVKNERETDETTVALVSAHLNGLRGSLAHTGRNHGNAAALPAEAVQRTAGTYYETVDL